MSRLFSVIESYVWAGLSDEEIEAEVKAVLKRARKEYDERHEPAPPVA